MYLLHFVLQLNITVFSHSEFDLCFNLYPLKSNFQPLPELQLEYNTAYETQIDENILANEARLGTDDSCKSVINQKQMVLNGLVQRWMPKILFVHVSIYCFSTYTLHHLFFLNLSLQSEN